MLTKEDALRAYAVMMNTQDESRFAELLADDFHYASQWVFAEIESKQAYLDYIRPKLLAVKKSGSAVWAEMAHLEREMLGPCVVMAQGEKENLISLVLTTVVNEKITRLDMCGAPSPNSARRSGDYPGRPTDAKASSTGGRTVDVMKGSADQALMATIAQGGRPHQKRMGLREAYQASVYQFDADGCTYTLRVGEQNIAVATLFKKHSVTGAAFITAHNPASLQLGAVHNELADRALKRDLSGLAKLVLPGFGRDPDGAWPSEQSLLAAGIKRSQAEMLARRYGQYAILWVDAEGQVSLVELTDLDKASRYPLKVPPFGWVELGVNWGYEWATLRLTPSQWLHILQGDDFSKTSRSGYDGKAFTLSWGFSGGTHLDVSYGDGGCAYNGELSGVSLTLVAHK